MSGAERRHRVPAGRRDTDHGPVIADCRVLAHVRRLGTGCNEKITRAAARDQRRVTGDIINTSQKAITTRSGKHGGRKLLPSILFDILFIIMPWPRRSISKPSPSRSFALAFFCYHRGSPEALPTLNLAPAARRNFLIISHLIACCAVAELSRLMACLPNRRSTPYSWVDDGNVP